MTTAYPLAWPEGWPRTNPAHRSGGYQFKQAGEPGSYSKKLVTFDRARKLLTEELQRMKATNVVLSTNLPIRQDGWPYADAARRKIEDPGVAVYFTIKDRPMVMACDGFDYIAANMRSLGLAIEAMRQLERHGGGHMMDKAFAGFTALPPPKSCWDILGVAPGSSKDAINKAFRLLAGLHHPDAGGSTSLMAELNAARDQALKEAA